MVLFLPVSSSPILFFFNYLICNISKHAAFPYHLLSCYLHSGRRMVVYFLCTCTCLCQTHCFPFIFLLLLIIRLKTCLVIMHYYYFPFFPTSGRRVVVMVVVVGVQQQVWSWDAASHPHVLGSGPSARRGGVPGPRRSEDRLLPLVSR